MIGITNDTSLSSFFAWENSSLSLDEIRIWWDKEQEFHKRFKKSEALKVPPLVKGSAQQFGSWVTKLLAPW